MQWSNISKLIRYCTVSYPLLQAIIKLIAYKSKVMIWGGRKMVQDRDLEKSLQQWNINVTMSA